MKYRWLIGALAWLATAGCAISDYDGFDKHQTQSEAKLWGQEIAFDAGPSDPLSGTYSYTVKYDNRNGRDTNLKIITYRNPVVGSFSRDGLIDRDGDDIQGRSGDLGGTFHTQWTAVDSALGCQFETNVQVPGNNPAPLATLCVTGALEEVDKDLDLQATFTSLGDLAEKIFAGTLGNGFTAEITSVQLGGNEVALSSPVVVSAKSNGLRPYALSVDLTGAGGAALVQAILDNTSDGVPVPVGLGFSGGMKLNFPASYKVAFNHQVLASFGN
jgi:hypothetical protein